MDKQKIQILIYGDKSNRIYFNYIDETKLKQLCIQIMLITAFKLKIFVYIFDNVKIMMLNLLKKLKLITENDKF